MLIKNYILKLANCEGRTVNVEYYNNKPTEEQIKELLLKYKDIAISCEISENYRLHNNTLFSNQR
jgi:hypothetical protein